MKAISHYKHIKPAINNFHKPAIIIHNYKDYYVKMIQYIYHMLQQRYLLKLGLIIQHYIMEI